MLVSQHRGSHHVVPQELGVIGLTPGPICRRPQPSLVRTSTCERGGWVRVRVRVGYPIIILVILYRYIQRMVDWPLLEA